MSENYQKAVSFGFTKCTKSKLLLKSVVDRNNVETKAKTDFVLSLEDNEVRSTAPSRKKESHYVIPLSKKMSVVEHKNSIVNSMTDVNLTDLDLDQRAKMEIIEESAMYKHSSEYVKPNQCSDISIVAQNTISECIADKGHNDLPSDRVIDADYEKVPIEHFGLAMLRGMGWKEGNGVGKNAKIVAPFESILRPKSLGLGADRSKTSGEKITENIEVNDDVLVLSKGSYIVVLSGKYKGLYGVVEGFDEDYARVILNLSIVDKRITATQFNVKTVSKDEYDKCSKYINKCKYDEYKELVQSKETNFTSCDNDVDGVISKNNSKHTYREKHVDKCSNKKAKTCSDQLLPLNANSSLSLRSYNRGYDKIWLCPYLSVRIIDKNFKKGLYYRVKVVVYDILSQNNVTCKTDDNILLDGLSQSQLETVIPRQDSINVFVCSGKYKGQFGVILKKERKTCQAYVELLIDKSVISFNFDEICEYTGEPDNL